MNAATLFSSIGVAEYYLENIGIDVIVSNEVVESRAIAHQEIYPNCEMIIGDITNVEIQSSIIKKCKENEVKLLMATPPCQGLSTAGINKTEDSIKSDPRNFLILSALNIFDAINSDYFLIENVPRFEKMVFPFEGEYLSLEELLKTKYGNEYNVHVKVFNAALYGVPQTRFRVVYRIWKKGLEWIEPEIEKMISLEEAIGSLPSLEAGMNSDIINHNARQHPDNHIECMRYTQTGKSAFENEEYYPKKIDGTPIKGFKNTYKRMRWDLPAPTITMRNEIISSQENVHPGRELGNGMWSDARVLTLRELLIVSSLPSDMSIPTNLTDTSFRQLIGEGIPPLMIEKILKGISNLNE